MTNELKVSEEIHVYKMGFFHDLEYYFNPSFMILISRENNSIISYKDNDIKLNENDLIVYSGKHAVDVKNVSGSIIYVFISGSLPEKYLDHDRLNIVYNFGLNDVFIERKRKIETALFFKNTFKPQVMAEIGFGLLLDIYMHEKKIEHKISKIVKEAVTIIENNYANFFNVDELADMLNINKSYLIRVFSKDLNITPGKYLENYRVEKAKAYIQADDLTFDMISKMCGYSSGNYFSKVFKKQTGLTPKQFRNSQMQDEKYASEEISEMYL